MQVDSFKYLPRLVARYYKLSRVERELPIPWTPVSKSLNQARFALVTSGGLYHRGVEPAFDLDREREEPTWGDPSYRTLPSDIRPAELGVSHFHINHDPVLADLNILLPIQRFKELADEGQIGSLAEEAYSFMGYQGFPANLSGWREVYGPEVTAKMSAAGVDTILLTAA